MRCVEFDIGTRLSHGKVLGEAVISDSAKSSCFGGARARAREGWGELPAQFVDPGCNAPMGFVVGGRYQARAPEATLRGCDTVR